jgi:hypothetical protein
MSTSKTKGLEFDDGYPSAAPKLAKQVAWTRQARAYRRLRDKIDAHYLRAPKYKDGAEVVLEIPHRLSGWRPALSALVRDTYPELIELVRQIELLKAQRATMRADKSFIPASTRPRGTPLPADPAEREAERTRRAVASMRALRESRRAGQPSRYNGGRAASIARQSAKKRDPANAKNLDLIGL